MSRIATLAVLAASGSGAAAFDNHGASVQLFEWSWADVASECETFLGPKGYKTAQVSPPQEHIQGSEWWTRYQPVSYNLTSRSGNEAQFADMISRCSDAGVGIIVDSVINHMAAGSGTGTAGSSYGSRQYPMYGQEDFHHYSGNSKSNCEVDDYDDKDNVQLCDLVGLPDLLTSSQYVQETVAAYLNKCASLGAVGFRIDAAKHQDADELAGITKRLSSSLYVATEVIGAEGEAVQPEMYYGIGQVSEFYYSDDLCSNVKVENKMKYLENFGEEWGLMPEKYAAVFIDNHDTQRSGRAQLTYKNGDTYTFANIFMLAWDYGNARVMSSYYFTDTDAGPPSVGVNGGSNCMDNRNWVCEHRWGPIANMVGWRNTADTSAVANWQEGDANQIAFSRGGKAFIAMNRGSGQWSATLQTSLSAGTYCNVIASDDTSSCSDTVEVSSSGEASVKVSGLSAVAIHANAKKN
jgi:alpha-amylase